MLYYLSLEPCPVVPFEFVECVAYIQGAVKFYTLELMIASGILCTLIILVLKKRISRWWILVIVLNLTFWWKYDTDMTFNHHGGLNFTIFIALIFINLLMYLLVKGVIKLCKASNYLKIIVLVILIGIPTIIYFMRVRGSCDRFNNGIADLEMVNSDQECMLTKPGYCELTARKGWMDISGLSKTCDRNHMTLHKNTLPKELQDSHTQHLGFPRIEDWDNINRVDQLQFLSNVRGNMIDMDSSQIDQSVKDSVEFTINM